MSEPRQRWRVIIDRDPRRVMRRLPKNLLQQIDRAIQDLANDPRPPGCVKLTGFDDIYRVRVGDWRISYVIEDDRLIVLILKVAPRGGAYRF